MPKVISHSYRALGILNPYGTLWSPRAFDSVEQAKKFFDEFWMSPGFKGRAPDWRKYKVVPVSATIRVVKSKDSQP